MASMALVEDQENRRSTMSAVEDIAAEAREREMREQIAKRLSFGDVTATLRSAELPAGVGDVFRAASCAEPPAETLKRALEELTNANERFERVRSVAMEQAEGNGEGDAARLRQHFQSLKSTYTQLQTKDEFIRRLNASSFPTEEEFAKLEETVDAAKLDIKSTKDTNVESTEAMTSLIAEIATTYENFIAESAFLRKKVEEVAAAEALAREEDEDVDANNGLTVEACDEMLARIAEEDKVTASDTQKKEEEVKRLEAEIAMGNLRVESLQTEAAELQRGDKFRTMKDAEEHHSIVTESWCDSMYAFLSKLSRVQVVSASQHAIELTIRVKDSEYTCKILLYETSGTVRDIELSPSNVSVADVVEAVRDTRHVEAAVHEIQALLIENES